MNIANKITVCRIISVPFFVYFLINNMYVMSFLVFLLAALTDHLDGKIARERNQVTDFGKFADPLADKMLVMSAFICFIDLHQISAVAVILFLIREFMVMSVRLVSAKDGKVISANNWGKAKTVSQIFAVFFIIGILSMQKYYFSYYIENESFIILVREILIWISVVLSYISGSIYIYKNHKVLCDI